MVVLSVNKFKMLNAPVMHGLVRVRLRKLDVYAHCY